jgi:predicted lipoprotein with Yx(FWY)xxD motif
MSNFFQADRNGLDALHGLQTGTSELEALPSRLAGGARLPAHGGAHACVIVAHQERVDEEAVMRGMANRSRRCRGFGWIQFAVVAAALLATAAAAAAVDVRSHAARPLVVAEAISTKKAPTISTKKIPKLGTVLVNGQGRTLYMFVPDKRKKVTCVRSCAVVWPPVKLSKGQKAVASGQAKSSLLGSDPNPAGGRVVTYAAWPLYTYVADTSAGAATGQALNLNGGLWYVLAPSGKLIRTKP